MKFIKYHGLGNDFLVFARGLDGARSLTPEEVVAVCDRRFGVGADGVILARPSEVAALRMELVNSDGTTPEMCGNGIRCLVAYAVDELGFAENPLEVETLAGVLACAWRRGEDGRMASVRVSMGRPVFERALIPVAGEGDALALEVSTPERTFVGTGVGTGNPHYVLFGDARRETASHYGPLLERHPTFPRGTNVEFAEVLAPDHIRLTVWERGCGLTMACGTGATATVAAAVRHGLVRADAPVRVSLPGGDLAITVSAALDAAIMEGPAREVFRGRIHI
ncbi:MAG: diaminopimelate epimerase [Deltaproteobacteria bacterium]|nr:diaminopimelate epimerase [Deltaproteobacteria bacterium]MCB9786054.1 diaminopimelate epimerase [Deltaproteobacteria bacterium]